MFKIITNKNCKAEKIYIFDVIFANIFNLEYTIDWDTKINKTVINFENSSISTNDHIFSAIYEHYMKPESLPTSSDFKFININFSEINLNFKDFPICFSQKSNPIINKSDKNLLLNFDIFGLMFILLSRYEEYVYSEVSDHFGRFPYSNSFLSKQNLIKYPIVDIYILFLSKFFKIKLPNTNKKLSITFDLDAPVLNSKPSIKHNLRCLFRDIFIWRCPLSGVKKFFNNHKINRLYHFKKINYLLKRYKYKGTFYLLVDKIHKHDGTYYLDDLNIKHLIKYLIKKGHKIGLHFSFTASSNVNQLRSEIDKFKIFLKQITKRSLSVDVRFHFLRINMPMHINLLDEFNIHNDSSLGFAEQTGFRCGTARSYPAYSFSRRSKLKLTITPLVIMDVTYNSVDYMNIDHSNPLAFEDSISLINRSFNTGATTTVLFHDNLLLKSSTYKIFKKIVSY